MFHGSHMWDNEYNQILEAHSIYNAKINFWIFYLFHFWGNTTCLIIYGIKLGTKHFDLVKWCSKKCLRLHFVCMWQNKWRARIWMCEKSFSQIQVIECVIMFRSCGNILCPSERVSVHKLMTLKLRVWILIIFMPELASQPTSPLTNRLPQRSGF